jgi:cathepsin B
LGFLLALGFLCSLSWADELNALHRVVMEKRAEAKVEAINRKGLSWKAEAYPRFASMSLAEKRKQLLGLARNPEAHRRVKAVRMAEKMRDQQQRPKPTDDSFDAREQWPECADVIGRIQDQSMCGSCWAVSSTSVMSDRFCIASNGTIKLALSAEDLMACDYSSDGCYGGYPDKAFAYWQKKGVCTGGKYEQRKVAEGGCKPYPFPASRDADQDYDTPSCKKRCENTKYTAHKYGDDLHYGSDYTNLQFSDQEDIKDAMRKGGTVEADMVVYEDFFYYKSGVYQYDGVSEEAGGHAVRFVAWGTDNATGLPYWLVANSWNDDWGEKGYFRIIRGQDDCEIESWGTNYGEPDLSKEPSQ